jgi:hypothetical protein
VPGGGSQTVCLRLTSATVDDAFENFAEIKKIKPFNYAGS